MSTAPQFATAGRRIAAYIVDFGVLGPPLLAAVARLDPEGDSIRGGGALALFVADIYHVLFEGTTAQTPGKRALGIRVADADGGPRTDRAATLRTLGRFVDSLPVAYLAAFVSMALTERRQRLGDLLGATVVIRGGDGE